MNMHMKHIPYRHRNLSLFLPPPRVRYLPFTVLHCAWSRFLQLLQGLNQCSSSASSRCAVVFIANFKHCRRDASRRRFDLHVCYIILLSSFLHVHSVLVGILTAVPCLRCRFALFGSKEAAFVKGVIRSTNGLPDQQCIRRVHSAGTLL